MKGVTAIHLVKRSVQTSGKTTVHKSNVTREGTKKVKTDRQEILSVFFLFRMAVCLL